MTIDVNWKPPRFSTRGANGVKEYDFTRESWEPEEQTMGCGVSKPAVDEGSALDEIPQYANMIRFINKNEDNRLLVNALAQKDSAVLWKFRVGANSSVQVAGTGGEVGGHFEKEPVPGGDLLSVPYCEVLDAGEEDNPSRAKRFGVPNGSEGLWYVWHAEVDKEWKFAGQNFAPKGKNHAFTDLGLAKM